MGGGKKTKKNENYEKNSGTVIKKIIINQTTFKSYGERDTLVFFSHVSL